MAFGPSRPIQWQLGFLPVHASLPQCPSARSPMVGSSASTCLDTVQVVEGFVVVAGELLVNLRLGSPLALGFLSVI